MTETYLEKRAKQVLHEEAERRGWNLWGRDPGRCEQHAQDLEQLGAHYYVCDACFTEAAQWQLTQRSRHDNIAKSTNPERSEYLCDQLEYYHAIHKQRREEAARTPDKRAVAYRNGKKARQMKEAQPRIARREEGLNLWIRKD